MRKQIRKILVGIIILVMCLMVGCAKSTTYEVTFDSSGGTAIKSQRIKEGEKVEKPKNPKKEGFTFIEWLHNGEAYDFGKSVTENITLVASYSINEGTELVLVSFDADNGTLPNVVEIAKGNSVTAPPTPQKQGYEFTGWYFNDEKYDFSTEICENITLIAKWEADESAKKDGDNANKGNGKANGSNSNNNVSSGGSVETGNKTDTSQYDKIVDKYAGRWYLSGYADVCIDVSKKTTYYKAMALEAYNFNFPFEGSAMPPYTVYPDKSEYAKICSGWSSGVHVDYEHWNEKMKENEIVLGTNCIYINNKKFVKQQGTIDRYYDTCYKEALGTWYLENHPKSIVEIYTSSHGNFGCSDSFTIRTKNFDLQTFATNVSKSQAGYGRGDDKESFEQYGIWAENGKLTVTNANGTRVFYKTVTTTKVTGISFDVNALTLGIGARQIIKATVSPSDAYDKTITWSSNNTSVATVSATGTVTGVSEGQAVIKATTKDGNYVASCNVTVSEVHVTSVSINQTTMDLTIGNTGQLSVNVVPANAANKNVDWSSSNSSVAQVSTTGLVTAVGKGTAIITVKSRDGGHSAACTITVKEPTLSVDASIGLTTKASASGVVRGISVEIKPVGGSNTYVAYSIKLYYNDVLVGEGNNKEIFVTPANSGIYRAEVWVRDSSGNEASRIITSTITN